MHSIRTLLACFLPLAACSQGPSLHVPEASRPPDEVLAEYTRTEGLPAIAAVVLDRDGVRYMGFSGVRKADDPTPTTASDRFHLGSDTKAMTSLLCAMAVDDGLLTFDTTVGSVLGEVAGAYADVTLEALLSHTSGMPSELDTATWRSFFERYQDDVTTERPRMAAAALGLPPLSAQGERFRYSNFNYVVAGRMLEVVYGEPWETLMETRLFTPLGMAESGFGPPERGLGVTQPWGHSPDPMPFGALADNPPALGPAGTAHASVGDVATYLGFLLRGGVTATGTRLVSEAALAELFAPRPGSGEYGLGWVAHDDDGDRAYYHDGSNTLFYSSFVLFPERGLAIAVLTNRGDEPATLRVAELRAYLIERFVR